MCVTSSSYRQPDSKNLLALALIEIQHATWPFLAFFPTLGGEPLWPKTSGAPVHYECWTQVIASLCRNPKQHVQWAIVRRHGAAKNNITWRQSCGTKLFAYYYGFAKECIDVTVSVYEILLIHHNGILRGEVYFGLVRVLENTHHRTSISQKKQQPPKMFPSILIYYLPTLCDTQSTKAQFTLGRFWHRMIIGEWCNRPYSRLVEDVTLY